MVNGYYHFLTGSPWTPYLGRGVGAGHVAVSDAGILAFGGATFSDSDWQFAYQGIAGVLVWRHAQNLAEPGLSLLQHVGSEIHVQYPR